MEWPYRGEGVSPAVVTLTQLDSFAPLSFPTKKSGFALRRKLRKNIYLSFSSLCSLSCLGRRRSSSWCTVSPSLPNEIWGTQHGSKLQMVSLRRKLKYWPISCCQKGKERKACNKLLFIFLPPDCEEGPPPISSITKVPSPLPLRPKETWSFSLEG